MNLEYKKEFFDREYTACEAYARVWKYARKYKFRIFIGLLSGMLTAGTMLPMLQVIQPALEKVSQNERLHERLEGLETNVVVQTSQTEKRQTRQTSFERELEKKSKLPSWYPKAEKVARKLGIKLQDESGAMGGALLLIAIVVIPFVAGLRLLFIFLNQYCLCWAATRAVNDLRVDLFRQIQRQSLQFYGRIDVGQLMSRAGGDPTIVQSIIQSMFAELCRAPFEILLAVGFILWFAVANHMLATLGIIAIGMPLFLVPIVSLGKRIRRWSRKALEKTSVVTSNLHEVLTCVRVVKAYGTEEQEVLRFEATNRKLLGTIMRSVRYGLIVSPTISPQRTARIVVPRRRWLTCS